jgi:hypothetical protein
MSDMLELAKRIAERAGKNAKVAPELLYAPILWELQDDARSSAVSEQPIASEGQYWASQLNACWDRSMSDALKTAAQKALNYIENTEGELGMTLSCGDALRAALAACTEPQAARADIEDIADIIRDKAYADENDKIGGVHDAAQKIVEYLTTLPARCQAESAPQSFDAIRSVLRDHWLTGMHCDHDANTDVATCFCTVWRSEPMPNVGAAVNAWIEHVLSHAFTPSAPVVSAPSPGRRE